MLAPSIHTWPSPSPSPLPPPPHTLTTLCRYVTEDKVDRLASAVVPSCTSFSQDFAQFMHLLPPHLIRGRDCHGEGDIIYYMLPQVTGKLYLL